VIATGGNVVTLVALPLYVLAETGSASMAGVLAVVTTVPVVLGGAFGGVLVDRVGYRRSSVVSDLVGGVAIGMVPLLHVTVGLPFWALLVLVFATGLLDTPGQGARTALVPEAAALAGVPLERAMGWWGAGSRSATLLGGPVAGLLVATLGAVPALVVNAATFALSALVVVLGVPRALRPTVEAASPVTTAGTAAATAAGDREGYWAALRAGVAVIWRVPLLRAVVLLVMVTNALDVARANVLVPVYADRVLGGAQALGLIVGAMGLGAFAGALVFSAVGPRLPRRATFAWGFLLAGGPSLLVFALQPSLVWCLVATALAGLAAGALNPIIGTVLLEEVPPSMRARVSGAVSAGAWAAMPVGALAAGVLVEQVGLVACFVGFGVVYVLVTLVPFLPTPWRAMDRRAVGLG
jgi:MFS family permease